MRPSAKVTRPKSHHYVPRFYLSRFADAKGRLWVLDKPTGKKFRTTVENLACVNHFYELPELAKAGLDANLLEKQFSGVEGQAAAVLASVGDVQRGKKIDAFEDRASRSSFALFLVLQILRTPEARRVLLDFLRFLVAGNSSAPRLPQSEAEERSLHADVLWHDTHVRRLVRRVSEMIWFVGYNESDALFLTSDNPALEKSGDHRGWVVNSLVTSVIFEGVRDPSDNIVFPLSPRLVLYCYDRKGNPKMTRLGNTVTPVPFTSDMVNHENSGQVGMSSRFVYSTDGDFSFAEEFIRDQPWVQDPERARFADRKNPYEASDTTNDAKASGPSKSKA